MKFGAHIVGVTLLLLLCAASAAQTPSPESLLPSGPGREVTIARCGLCHSIRNVLVGRQPRDYWEDKVEEMAKQAGWPADDPDKKVIIDYLATAFASQSSSTTPAAPSPDAAQPAPAQPQPTPAQPDSEKPAPVPPAAVQPPTARPAPAQAVPVQIKDYKPVTAETLLNPSPNDWIHFRRTYDHQGYSPLDQINRQNVHQLQLAWSWTMHPGMSEATPQVYNGIMFITNPSGGIQALNAATGDLLWDWETPMNRGGGNNAPRGGQAYGNAAAPTRPIRNLALWGDKVYTGTDDTHGSLLTALDARTGKVVWQTKVGFGFSGGPTVINGKVITGTQNCDFYKNDDPPCWIGAYDAETGETLWRTSTVARPGEPGGETWGDLPLKFRAGGDNWQAGSYDPKLNLTFWGTAQAKPWVPYQRGTDGTALYTSSTLALDVNTGKIVWYYQHIPGEAFDQDETFERVLIDYDGKSSTFSMGKIGILWELDRKSGAYRAAYDLGYQDQVTIDPKTGQAKYLPDRLPKPGVPISFCPNIGGVKTWRAMSYHPQTQALYIPLSLVCAKNSGPPKATAPEDRVVGGHAASGFGKTTYFAQPKSPDALGEFVAMDIKSGKILWRRNTRTPSTMSALTTGGGLVVHADWDRNLYIHDVANGKILYQTRLPGVADGSPSTYSVGGRQYIAIPLGTGSGGTWVVAPRELIPEIKNPRWAEWPVAVMVFALPQQPK